MKYFSIAVYSIWWTFSCLITDNKSIQKPDYSDLYNKAFNELGPFLNKCVDSFGNNLESISLSDSLYILANLDTMRVGDKNYNYIPLMVRDSSGTLVLNDVKQENYSFDANHFMLKYNWDEPLLNREKYSTLNLNRKVRLLKKRDNNISLSFSAPYQQKEVVLVLAKIHSNNVFFVDDFFVFIEMKTNDQHQFKVHKIFDSVHGCE